MDLRRGRDVRLGPTAAVASGVVIGLVAIGTKALIQDTLGDPGYILLMAAVVTAAWLGGVPRGAVGIGGHLRAGQPPLS